ncbi:hypothetical protein [Streptomyces sp. NPDC007346]|uniref:hypothetical protein n=1 Tax=Streptomyces sp. NPDC007346 TaxID=3154682 RepID=UPI0034530EED
MSQTTDAPRRPSSLLAEAAFRARLAELGATLLEPAWLGNGQPHRVRCAAGHDCTPRPNSVQKGRGVCRTCAGSDPATAEAAFRARLAELGATLLEPAWLGNGQPHRVRCAAGHDCTPQPRSVQGGRGVCRTCARRDPASAEAAFRARLAELGATLLEPAWLGATRGHRVRCAAGHDCTPRPNGVQQGEGICRTCVGMDPATAEAAFRARLAELGATLLEPVWLGNDRGHRVRCAAGHDCTPRPSHVQQGGGACRSCAGKVWDAFYVVRDDVRDVLKLGITSGDPRPRLRTHARAGFRAVLRVHRDLPGDVAPALERTVLAALAEVREAPVQGREFFPARVEPLVLALVDSHLSGRHLSARRKRVTVTYMPDAPQ